MYHAVIGTALSESYLQRAFLSEKHLCHSILRVSGGILSSSALNYRCRRKLQRSMLSFIILLHVRCGIFAAAPAPELNLVGSVRLPPDCFAAMGCKSSVQVVSFDELGDKGMSGRSDCPVQKRAASREVSKTCAKKRPSLPQVATQQLDSILPQAFDFKEAGPREADLKDSEGCEECGAPPRHHQGAGPGGVRGAISSRELMEHWTGRGSASRSPGSAGS